MRYLGLGFAGLLLLSSCAIATPHRQISQWPVTKRAMYYRDPLPSRLVLIPLIDRRPPRERQGQRASGLFLLLWNRRKGDYYTGDHVFGNDVPRQLTQQLAEFLKASNAFASIEVAASRGLDPESVSRAEVSAVAQTHNADYVLAGELHHFFGTQFQHTSMYLLPLYFINTFGWQDQKSLPWGQTAIRFVLYEGRSGENLWRRMVEAKETLPRETDSMSDAALESFATTAGLLASDLRQVSN
jgi:hypothetical protein